ncbi:MAG: DUF4352 domain-containing protein [Candidatus Saccharimonadales bacterium]
MDKPDKKSIARKTNQLFRASLALLLVSSGLLIFTVGYYRQHSSGVQSVKPQNPIAINQPISIGLVDLQVSDIKTTNGSQPFIAPAGKQYVIANLKVKNRSDQPLQLLPSTDTYVKDQTGQVIYLSPYALENPLRAGQLLPGETISGQVSYLVSKNIVNKLYIDASWSGGVIPFALN